MVYLDNAATTKPSESAVKAMIKAAECFGNPSSLYKLGIESEKIINKSRDIIASMLSVDAKNIYFRIKQRFQNQITPLSFIFEHGRRTALPQGREPLAR